jgi:hypothetical protein
MKSKELTLKKIAIFTLDANEMNSIKGGFDLEDYATSSPPPPPQPKN